ncbi:MAG: tetratricopeptide repeat protein, partial [Phycisphaerales bacterium]
MSFLSDASYSRFLDEQIRTVDDVAAREHIRKMLDLWRQQYLAHRLVERMAEMLSEGNSPCVLYLQSEADIHLVGRLARRHRFDGRTFRGFLAADDLWSSLKPEWFAPFPVHRAGEWRDRDSTVVFTLSSGAAFRDNGTDRGTDDRERVIDPSWLAGVEEIRRRHEGRKIVLYADYRKVQTIAAVSDEIRRCTDLFTVLLADSTATAYRRMFDHVIEQPCMYLWPLALKTLAADIVHVNVGWGAQGLPLMPFVPDPERTIVDFYDVTELVPEDQQEGSEQDRALARTSERYLWRNFRHFVHRCFEPVSDGLKRRHPDRDIVSLVEYVREPMYSRASDAAGDLKIVYAGIIIQDASDRESVYYSRFTAMANSFAKGNLHLHIYPSPYLYGADGGRAVKELIQSHGLTNVHACEPLEEDEFVRAISTCDYGMTPPADVRPCRYPDSLPYKLIAYLRAGLPILVPEDLTYLAEIVRKHDIGVAYRYEDLHRMPEILSRQNVRRQKENVARFRSTWDIAKGGAKMAALYRRMLEGETERKEPAVLTAPSCGGVSSDPPAALSVVCDLPLEGRTFLSEREYGQYLAATIDRAEPAVDKEHVRSKYGQWFEVYRRERMRQRAEEMLRELQGRPYALYLDDGESLHVASQILKTASRDQTAGFKGFVVEDEFLATWESRRLGSHSVTPRSQSERIEAVLLSLSGRTPSGARSCLVNDYREKFVDLARFEGVREVQRCFAGHPLVLYPLYREIQTASLLAGFVRRKDEGLRTVSLSPGPLLDADFDAALVEPFLYLWPLIFRILDSALVHLNVGWGIQALPLSPFLPDRRRAVIDFYEVLSFLPDAYFEKTHSTAEQVRRAEEHFLRGYDNIIHLCSDEISTRLAEKYDHQGSIVSVTEYLHEPLYCAPPRNDGEIRLVYGGCILASTNPDDLYYSAFMKVAPYHTRGNLRLYIYNSPYVHGLVENDPLKEVIRTHGLTNIHACKPLKLDDFVREISGYDYGITLLRARDMNAAEYNYFMATKFLTYLQAGLPVVVYASNRFMAGLVERYGIGVILDDCDLEGIPDALNRADLPSLKKNVVEFRDRFSIDKGGEKVLRIYREILDRSSLHAMRSVAAKRRVAPTRNRRPRTTEQTALPAETVDRREDFQEMIDVMARRENRLYYRDQSARTMSSLAALARQLKPSVIVELGTLGGLSLRTWIASTSQTRIYAVDLSFQTLRETMEFLPADLSRVTLLEQDILKTDFPRLWSPQDKVIFFVDAHDLPNVPIMKHVLETVLPSLPDGSLVVVDDLWFSEERLTHENARGFLEDRVCNEIDELQCFSGHYAPYHEGGSFLGFAEVIPLLEFVNRCGIPLVHEPGSKHVFFIWEKAYLSSDRGPAAGDGDYGCSQHNPMETVPVSSRHSQMMREIACRSRKEVIRGAAESLSKALAQDPRDPGLSYGLAVCLARGGMLSQARDVLSDNLNNSSSARYRRLYEDLVRRVGASEARPVARTQRSTGGQALTIFTMPKAFTGHNGTIQRNAIRSWARLDPKPEIIVFGDEPGVRETAEEVGARYVPDVARNEFGTPLVDKLFHAAQDLASHETMAYVNADMILVQDFVTAVQKVGTGLENFLLIGRRWDLDVLDEIDFEGPRWRESLQQQLAERAMLHAESGLDYFVFRKGLWPRIPSFAIGRTAWDNWLVSDPRRRGVPVVDGTECITAVHQDHDYHHAAGGRHGAWNGPEAVRNRSLAGPLDESAYTTGAGWVLRKDGQLVQTPFRQPEAGMPGFRGRRIAWLAKQAEWLMAHKEAGLAACKWEETLTLLDKVLSSKSRNFTAASSLDKARVTRCYTAACVSLAKCHAQTGRIDLAAASYTRFLEAPWVEIPPIQREELTRLRDQLLAGLPQEGGRTPDQAPFLPRQEQGTGKRIALIVSIPERREGLRG